jgi:hypothetical protein
MKRSRENAEPEPRDNAIHGPSGIQEGIHGAGPQAHDFHPVRIVGEPLSETIIRERRERPW